MKNRQFGLIVTELTDYVLPYILKKGGCDFFILDCEHGNYDRGQINSIIAMSRQSGIKCLLRLSDNRRENIIKYADSGAGGFILPMCDNAEDIKKVISYALYPPEGKRGIANAKIYLEDFGTDFSLLTKARNTKMQIYAQIETEKALENLENIACVKGLSGLILGPNDLSYDLGLPIGCDLTGIIEKIAHTAKNNGISSGIITANHEYLNRAIISGMDIITTGTETDAFINGVKQWIINATAERKV